jgi:hypothetical protein
MDDATPVNVSGFELKACKNTALERQRNQPLTLLFSKCPTNGVAIYRNLNSFTDCQPIVTIDVNRKLRVQRTINGRYMPGRRNDQWCI